MSIETDNLIEKSDGDSMESNGERRDGNFNENNMQDDDHIRLDTILSDMTAVSNKSALQYKRLSDSCFFWTALMLHIFLVVCAMTVNDLDIVIEFTGAIGCSSTLFLFPGLAYILALHKYGKPSHRQKWSTCGYQLLSWAFLIIYVAIISAFFYVEIGKALGDLPENLEVHQVDLD